MKIKIKWYQGFILLAAFDAVVIFFALEVHRDMVGSVSKLMESAAQADEINRLCRRLEQCILELNAPGNDVFVSGDVRKERHLLEQARTQLDLALRDADAAQLNTAPLKHEVDTMVMSANEVFERMEKSHDKNLSAEAREQFLKSASEYMARMDARQIAAIRDVGILVDRGRDVQKTMLDEHEASLQARVEMESYFIGFIGLLLFGLLWFGYRLHKVDQELEAHRRLAEEERRERLAAIGELCSSVAHGIRNPLAAIRSSAQLTLELGKLDEPSRSRLKDILSEGARLGDRVTGLLSMAKATSGQFEDLCLQDIINGAVKGLAPELERLGLALRQDIPERKIRIKGDRRQLEQLVIELISNAMEYSPKGAQIVLRCDRPHDNGRAQIVIEDAGPGVPVEVRERVFDLFFTTKPSGTGIGLATVKRIARMHHGDVELTSSSRGGACFTVTLPTAEQAIRELQTQEEGNHA